MYRVMSSVKTQRDTTLLTSLYWVDIIRILHLHLHMFLEHTFFVFNKQALWYVFESMTLPDTKYSV